MKAIADMLDSAADGLIERTHSALPIGDAVCVDLFEQWRDSFEMARRHPGEPKAVEYATATQNALFEAMTERGITEI